MESRTQTLLAGWIGVVGFALAIVGGLLAGEFDDPSRAETSAIVDFYQGTSFDAGFVTGAILETLGFLLLLAFVAKLADAIRGWSGTSWIGTVALASVIIATILTILAIVSLGAATFRSGSGGFTADGYVVLTDVRDAVYWLSLPAWALVYLTIGTEMVRIQSHRVWLGWVALVIGAGHIVAPFIDSVDLWNAVTGLGGLWFLAVAVHMLASPDRYST